MIADFVANYTSKKDAIKAFSVLEDSFYINAKSDTQLELKCREPSRAESAAIIIESTKPTSSVKVPQTRSSLPKLMDLVKLQIPNNQLNDICGDFGTQTAALLEMYNYIIPFLFFQGLQQFISLITPIHASTLSLLGIITVIQLTSLLVSRYTSVFSNPRTSPNPSKQFNLSTLPFFGSVLAAMALALVFEVVCKQMYAGPYAAIVGLMPVGGGVAISIAAGVAFKFLSSKYGKDSDQRKFVFQLFQAFAPLVLTLFFYIPNENLFNGIHTQVNSSTFIATKFKLSTSRVLEQSKFFTIQQPLIATIMAFAPPLLKSIISKNVPVLDLQMELSFVLVTLSYTLIFSRTWFATPFAAILFLMFRRAAIIKFLSVGYLPPQPLNFDFKSTFMASILISILLSSFAVNVPLVGVKNACWNALVYENLAIFGYILYTATFTTAQPFNLASKEDPKPVNPEWAKLTTQTRVAFK